MTIIEQPWRTRRVACFACGRGLTHGTFSIEWEKEEDNAYSEIVLRCAESDRDLCASLSAERAHCKAVAARKERIRNRLARPRAALPLP